MFRTASTNAKMQTPTINHKRETGNRCTYVIIGHSDAGLLFVPSTLSMSHLGRWSGPGLLIQLAMGSVKPHVRRWNARPAFDHQTRRVHAAMPATSVRYKSDCRECQVRLNLLRELFKVPECRTIDHSSDSMLLTRGAADVM